MYILVLTVPMGRDQKQTHLWNDHKYLLAYFCTCSIYCVQYDQSSIWSIYFTGLQTKTWEDSKPIGFLWISCVLRHMDAWYDQVLTNNPENLSGPCKQQWLSFLGHFSALTLLTNPPQSRHRSQGEKTIPSLYSGMSPSACHSVATQFSWEEVGLWAIPEKSIGWWDIKHISPTVLGSLLRGSWNLRKPVGPYKHETVLNQENHTFTKTSHRKWKWTCSYVFLAAIEAIFNVHSGLLLYSIVIYYPTWATWYIALLFLRESCLLFYEVQPYQQTNTNSTWLPRQNEHIHL